MKCECCGEREAGSVAMELGDRWEGLHGAHYSSECREELPQHLKWDVMAARIRDRRALVAHPVDYGAVALLPPDPALADFVAAAERLGKAVQRSMEFDMVKALTGHPWAKKVEGEWVDVRPVAADARCPGCVEGGKGLRCVYCAHRGNVDGFASRGGFDARSGNVAAARRMAAMDRKERPRVTAETRELSKPHPWEEFE